MILWYLPKHPITIHSKESFCGHELLVMAMIATYHEHSHFFNKWKPLSSHCVCHVVVLFMWVSFAPAQVNSLCTLEQVIEISFNIGWQNHESTLMKTLACIKSEILVVLFSSFLRPLMHSIIICVYATLPS